MNTITLKEAYARAPGDTALHIHLNKHAYKVLPEVVAAMEDVWENAVNDSPEMWVRFKAAIDKAKRVEVP